MSDLILMSDLIGFLFGRTFGQAIDLILGVNVFTVPSG